LGNRSLSAYEILNVWDQGISQVSARRGVLLLAAVNPAVDLDELLKLSIGERDAILLDLRERIFGPNIWGQANCPACNEHIEVRFATTDIRFAPRAKPLGDLSTSAAGFSLRFRLPSSQDLLSVSGMQDKEAAYEQLLKRCIIEIRSSDGENVQEQIPPEVVEAVVDGMEIADPQANIGIDLSCPSCGQKWLMIFDILSFLWSEIDAWAYRALREVHCLAAAYGWHEAEILSMSAKRRQIYLEMIGA
jgi:hypothetical protein